MNFFLHLCMRPGLLIYWFSWLKALGVKFSRPSGWPGSYISLIGFNPRWLKATKGDITVLYCDSSLRNSLTEQLAVDERRIRSSTVKRASSSTRADEASLTTKMGPTTTIGTSWCGEFECTPPLLLFADTPCDVVVNSSECPADEPWA